MPDFSLDIPDSFPRAKSGKFERKIRYYHGKISLIVGLFVDGLKEFDVAPPQGLMVYRVKGVFEIDIYYIYLILALNLSLKRPVQGLRLALWRMKPWCDGSCRTAPRAGTGDQC